MTFDKTDISILPGIGVIDYRYNDDHTMIAQHNYSKSLKEISFRGWYDPNMMNACESIVGVWHVKERK